MLAHMRFLKNIFPNPREKYLRSHASTRFQQRKGTLPGASYRMLFNAASQEVLSVSVEKHCFLKNVPPSGTCLEQSGWAVSCAGTTGCFIDFKPTEWKFGNGVSSGEQGALDPARERGRMAGCPHGAGSFVGYLLGPQIQHEISIRSADRDCQRASGTHPSPLLCVGSDTLNDALRGVWRRAWWSDPSLPSEPHPVTANSLDLLPPAGGGFLHSHRMEVGCVAPESTGIVTQVVCVCECVCEEEGLV